MFLSYLLDRFESLGMIAGVILVVLGFAAFKITGEHFLLNVGLATMGVGVLAALAGRAGNW